MACSWLENPRDSGAWWAAICGVAQSRTWLKRLSSSSSCFTILLVSTVQWSESAICVHVSPPSWTSLLPHIPHLTPLCHHSTELSSLCYSRFPLAICFVYGRMYIGEGNGNPLQYSCLENPVDRGAWWASVRGVAQNRTWLKQFSIHAYIGEGNGNPLQ